MAIALSIVEGNHNMQTQFANNRKGMEPELYDGALKGLVEVVLGYNWAEQTTPFGNNVLHVHVGKPDQHRDKSKRLEMETVSVEFIQAILNHDPGNFLLWQQNGNGDTPLHLAARFCQRGAVQEFLNRVQGEELVRMLRITNNKKDTPLHDAARVMSHYSLVKLLVEAAEPTDTLEPNEAGETALYLAAEFGVGEDLNIMLNYYNPSALNLKHKGPCGRTALHAATLWGEVKSCSGIIKKMMEIDRSIIRVQDDHGSTPLHCAASAKWRSDEYLQVLLDYDDKTDSALYIQDNQGRTALHVATLRSNWDGVKKLLTSCPDSVEIVDNKGQNVVHCAASLRCLTKLESFLELGYFEKLLNEKDVDGNTPLHILVATVPSIPVHLCFPELPDFISRHPLSKWSFNNQNLTAGDILSTNTNLLRHCIPYVDWTRLIPRGYRAWKYFSDQPSGVENDAYEINKEAVKVKQEAQYHLVVATLIAAVSFTAGFTLPGGVNQNPGKSLGMAVLTREAAFKAFLITDTMAFTFSALAVICYFRLADSNDFVNIDQLYRIGYLLTSLSLGAMMIAFLTAVCAVVSTTKGLTIAIFAISVLFFLPYLLLLRGNYYDAMTFLYRCTNWDPADTFMARWNNAMKKMFS